MTFHINSLGSANLLLISVVDWLSRCSVERWRCRDERDAKEEGFCVGPRWSWLCVEASWRRGCYGGQCTSYNNVWRAHIWTVCIQSHHKEPDLRNTNRANVPTSSRRRLSYQHHPWILCPRLTSTNLSSDLPTTPILIENSFFTLFSIRV